MKKEEVIKEHICCDVCQTKLYRREVYRNDGSYQNDYISVGNIDLCFNCAGKVFDIVFVRNINETELKEAVDKTLSRLNKLPYPSIDIGLVK